MKEFKIKAVFYQNGVSQGAVASPTFFSIYLDDLFVILNNSGLGCRIGPHF